MLQELVGAVEDALLLWKGSSVRTASLRAFRGRGGGREQGPDDTHLLRGESLAREVVTAGVEAPLDEVGVHAHEVLQLGQNSSVVSAVPGRAGSCTGWLTCFFSMILVMCACSAAFMAEKSISISGFLDGSFCVWREERVRQAASKQVTALDEPTIRV